MNEFKGDASREDFASAALLYLLSGKANRDGQSDAGAGTAPCIVLQDPRGGLKQQQACDIIRAWGLSDPLADESASNDGLTNGSAPDLRRGDQKRHFRKDVVATQSEFSDIAALVYNYVAEWIHSTRPGDEALASLREQWRRVCKQWTSISDEPVEYTITPHLPIMYACGTTPANATLVGQLLATSEVASVISKRLLYGGHSEQRDTLNVVTLCGGSGAELLAFAVHCNRVCAAAAAATTTHTPVPRVCVTVVDVHDAWRPSIAAYAKLLPQLCTHVVVDVVFARCNLLDYTHVRTVAAPLVRNADIVTCVYGLSELRDLDPLAAHAAVVEVATAMRDGALLLVVDPVSLVQDGAKPAWVRAAVTGARPAASLLADQRLKVRVPAPLFATPLARTHAQQPAVGAVAPSLQTLYAALGMRVGHDVKVFTNSWYHVFACHVSSKHHPASGGGQTASASDVGMVPDVHLAAAAQPTPDAPPSQQCGLVVVPDGALGNWLDVLQTRFPRASVHVAASQRDATGARTAARVLQTARRWRGRGGLLLADYGTLVALFGSAMHRGAMLSALDRDFARLISRADLVVVDQVQQAFTTFRKARPLSGADASARHSPTAPVDPRAAHEAKLRGRAGAGACSVRVLDVVQHLRPRRLVAIASTAANDVADGNSLERSENPTLWPRIAAALGPHRVPAPAPPTAAGTVALDARVPVPLAQAQTALLAADGTALGVRATATVARLVHLHPALLLSERLSAKTWEAGFVPCAGISGASAVPSVAAVEHTLRALNGAAAGDTPSHHVETRSHAPLLRAVHSGRLMALASLLGECAGAADIPARVVVFVHNTAAQHLLFQWHGPQACADVAARAGSDKGVDLVWDFPAQSVNTRKKPKHRVHMHGARGSTGAPDTDERQRATQQYRRWTAGALDNVTHTAALGPLCYNYNRLEGGCITNGCDAAHVCDRRACAAASVQHPRRCCDAARPRVPASYPTPGEHGADGISTVCGAAASTPAGCHVTVVPMTALHAIARTHPAADTAVFFDSDLATVSDALRRRREAHALSTVLTVQRRTPLVIRRFSSEHSV
eukprot:m.99360 g.99360  ORF g.99360 m.99360 type:complete len:1073 (+) comp16766_c0_seq19:523-3741(+)